MARKYKKTLSLVDLSQKKDLKIIKAEKSTISDEHIKELEDNIESRFLQFEEFNQYIIEQDLKNKPQISDKEFNSIMKDILKKHKILKSLLEEQKEM